MRGTQNLVARGLRGLGAGRPSLRLGLLVSAISVAIATALIYPLKTIAPVVSLSVVYVPAVLLASVYWGLWLGLATSLVSAAAFNFFHLPPVGRFTISDSRNWVALAAFVLIAAVVSTIADIARSRALEDSSWVAEASPTLAVTRFRCMTRPGAESRLCPCPDGCRPKRWTGCATTSCPRSRRWSRSRSSATRRRPTRSKRRRCVVATS